MHFLSLLYSINIVVYCLSFADVSLTVRNLADVMKRIRHVNSSMLSVHLEVPFSKRNEIQQQHQTLHQQYVALANYCISTLPGFSWARFAGALYYCKEEVALDLVAAKRYLKREEGNTALIVPKLI